MSDSYLDYTIHWQQELGRFLESGLTQFRIARYSLSHRTLILLAESLDTNAEVTKRKFLEFTGVDYLQLYPTMYKASFKIATLNSYDPVNSLGLDGELGRILVFETSNDDRRSFFAFHQMNIYDEMPLLIEYSFT